MAENPVQPENIPDTTLRPVRDALAADVRPLIQLLTKKIKDEFGLDVQMGFEREVFIDVKGIKGSQNLETSTHFKNDMEALRSQRYAKARALSSRISPVAGDFDIEVAVGQENPAFFEVKSEPAAPLRAVSRMDSISHQLERMAVTKEKIPMSVETQKAYADREESNSFTLEHVAFVPQKKITETRMANAGTHLNVSLWKDGRNITAEYKDAGQDRALWPEVVSKIGDYIASDTLLITPDTEAFERLETRKRALGDHLVRERFADGDQESERIELKAPANNARHDLAALMTLVGTYKALKDVSEPIDFLKEDEPFPKSMQEATAKFEQSKMLADLREITHDDGAAQQHIESLQKRVLFEARHGSLQQPGFDQRGR